MIHILVYNIITPNNKSCPKCPPCNTPGHIRKKYERSYLRKNFDALSSD